MLRKLANSTIGSTIRLRYVLAAMVCGFLLVAAAAIIPVTRGANPASGSVSESNLKVTWTGQIKVPTGSSDCGGPNNSGCDNFTVNFQPPSSGFGPYLLEIKLQPQGDWDMQVYGPNGNLVDGSGNGPGVMELVTLINPAAGAYTVTAAPFTPLVGTDGNSYAASAELKHYSINASAQGSDTNISYHNFAASGSLGNDAGEPSIGVDWKTNRAMMISGLQTLRATFDDRTIPAKATWEDKSFIWTGVISWDPILFTDRNTGRTIVSQLTTPAGVTGGLVLTAGCSLSAVSDDDGDSWIPDEGCGPPSGTDHQSIGGGPFAAPLPPVPVPATGGRPLDGQAAGGAVAGRGGADGSPVTGVAVGGGEITGRARVVLDPATAELSPGEILVCRSTDPGWVALFHLAGGVVVDTGGQMSHGAIVARELGLPCVTGTEDGTRRLRTGDLIRVDGAAGRVELVERVPVGGAS